MFNSSPLTLKMALVCFCDTLGPNYVCDAITEPVCLVLIYSNSTEIGLGCLDSTNSL